MQNEYYKKKVTLIRTLHFPVSHLIHQSEHFFMVFLLFSPKKQFNFCFKFFVGWSIPTTHQVLNISSHLNFKKKCI